jgi:catechol 2,3-dioxygenase-like lactoylglutathione lyase family enzyme
MKFVVEHIGVPAQSPTVLQEWYMRVLGGEMIWQDASVPVYFVKLAGGVMLEIGPCKRVVADVGDNSVAGIRHFALQVESIEVAKKELEARGVVFAEPVKPAGGGGSVLFFNDAEGNLLHFVERPAGSVFKK